MTVQRRATVIATSVAVLLTPRWSL